MSHEIDSRIVELRFDNKDFEKNTKESLDSLNKLDKSVDRLGSNKGVSNLQQSVNNFSMDDIAEAAELIKKRFSTLGVIGMSVMNRLTNSVMDFAHNMVGMFSPFSAMKDGMEEYELQINSVQTMLANYNNTAMDTAQIASNYMGEQIEQLRDITGSVINGDWGNGQKRYDLLTAAGYNYEEVQNAVNTVMWAEGTIEDNLAKLDGTVTRTGQNVSETTASTSDAVVDNTSAALAHVETVLDGLNEYADKTVYKFGDMTNAIGTFMTAGVDLETAATDVKGLSNLAAAVGANNEQLQRSMYMLSQGIAAGKISLLQWRSLERTAGMGGKMFQEALKKTAREHGVAVDAMIKKNGSFRDSLQEDWLTADIMNETLQKFTTNGLIDYFAKGSNVKGAESNIRKIMDETDKLRADAESDAEIAEIAIKQAKKISKYTKLSESEVQSYLHQALKMEDAATKVKTYSQLIDVVKEELGTGWATTWKYIIGNFEEAKKLWTKVSKAILPIIDSIADARNEMLRVWKEKGGRDDLIESVRNLWHALKSFVKPIHDAFRELFPRTTSEQLLTFTKRLKAFTATLVINEKHQEAIKGIFKGVFTILKGIITVIKTVIKVIAKVIYALAPIGKLIVDIIGGVGHLISKIGGAISGSGVFQKVTRFIYRTLNGIHYALSYFVKWIENLKIWGKLYNGIKTFGSKVSSKIGEFLGKIKERIAKTKPFEAISKSFREARGEIREGFSDYGDKRKWDRLPRWAKNLVVLFRAIKKTKFGKWVGNLGTNLKNTFNKIKKTGFAQWIKDVWHSFKTSGIPKILGAISTAFTKFKNVVTIAWNKLKEVLGFRHDDGVGKNLEKVAESSEKVADSFTNISDKISNLSDQIASFGGIKDLAAKMNPEHITESLSGFLGKKTNLNAFKTKIDNIFKHIYEFIKGDAEELNLDRVFEIGREGASGWFIYNAANMLKTMSTSVGLILSNTADVIYRFGRVLITLQNSLRVKMIRDLAIAIALLAGALKLISTIPPDRLWNAVGAISALTAVLFGLYAGITKISQGLSTKAIVALAITLGLLAFVLIGLGIAALGVAAAIGIVIVALKALRYIIEDYRDAIKDDPEGFFAGIKAIGQVIKSISKYLRNTFMASKHGGSVAVSLLALVAALWLLFKVIKMYASIPADEFQSGMDKVSQVILALTFSIQSLLIATHFVGGFKLIGVAAIFLALMFSLNFILKAIEKLIAMDPGKLATGMSRLNSLITMLGSFIVAISLSLISIRTMPGGFKAGGATTGQLIGVALILVTLTGVISVMATVIAAMGSLDESKFTQGMIFLGVVMASLAAFILVIGRFAKRKSFKAISALNSITFALMTCAVVVTILGSMKPAKALFGVAMLELILGGLGFFLSKAQIISNPKSLLALTTIILGIVALVVSLMKLAKMPFKRILAATLGLSAVIVSIGVMMKLVGKGFNVADMLMLLAISVSLVIVAESLSVLASYPVANMLTATLGLGAVMLAAAGAMAIVSKLHISVRSAFFAALAISTFIGIITGVFFGIFEGLGALFLKFEKMGPALDKGIEVMEKVFGGLGRMIGAFSGELAGSHMEHLSSHLDAVGANLDKFTDKIKPFFDTMKDANTVQLADISDSLHKVTDALAIIRKWSPRNDMTEQLDMFGKCIVPLGQSLNDFSKLVSGINTDSVNAAANAINAIAKIDTSKATSYTGDGKTQFTDLKKGLEDVASGIVSFSNAVSGENLDLDAIKKAVDAMNLIIGVDTSKGKEPLAFWNSSELEGFGKGLNAVGLGITQFSEKVSVEGAINNDAIKNAVEAMQTIATVDTKNFQGKSASKFKSFLGVTGGLGGRISDFANKVKDFDAASVTAVQNSATAMQYLASINFATYDGTNAQSFASNLGTLGPSLSTFYDNVNGLENLTTVGNDVKTFIDSIVSADISEATATLQGFALALESAGATAAGNFGTALSPTVASTTVVNFCMAALNTMLQFAGLAPTYALKFALGIAAGFTNGQTFVKLAAEALAKSGADAANNKYDAFVSSGKYLAQGLAQGMNSPDAIAKVMSAAKVLADFANLAFNNASEIKSPSKRFARSGMYLVLGLAKGMLDNADSAAEASKTLSDMVFAGFDQAMFDDIDPNPTIRPVLDLSNVQSGARTLGSLLGGYAPYTSFGLAGSISSGMLASEIQNGKKIYDNSSNVYNVTVNGAEGQDVNALADAVVNKIITVNKRKAAMNG